MCFIKERLVLALKGLSEIVRLEQKARFLDCLGSWL